MKHQQTFCVIALLGVISGCAAHIGGGQIALQNIGPHMYCGRTLARTLALLCYDEKDEKRAETDIYYNTTGQVKLNTRKSLEKYLFMAGKFINSIISPFYKVQDMGWPWMAPRKARSLILTSRSKRYLGAANECCEKPCKISELLQYC